MAASFFAGVAERAQAASGKGGGQIDLEALDDWGLALSGEARGDSEGQVKMFNNGGKAWAASWSAASQTWIEIGEVTGTGGETLNGRTYDHVVPVELPMSSGQIVKLQLGFDDAGEARAFAARLGFVFDARGDCLVRESRCDPTKLDEKKKSSLL